VEITKKSQNLTISSNKEKSFIENLNRQLSDLKLNYDNLNEQILNLQNNKNQDLKARKVVITDDFQDINSMNNNNNNNTIIIQLQNELKKLSKDNAELKKKIIQLNDDNKTSAKILLAEVGDGNSVEQKGFELFFFSIYTKSTIYLKSKLAK
jgi:hypothetical protein